jgi:glycine/D-amino acid oxidase-like deaminating enzyme
VAVGRRAAVGSDGLTAQKHIVVVGAGIIGASIAWHLTKAGARVTIVDAGEAGGVATKNSFAWINASWGNPEEYFRLRIRAMAEWRRLAEEVPKIPLKWSGGLLWDLPPAELDAYAREHSGWGYGIRRVDRADVLSIEPNLADPPAFALHIEEEGAAEPRLTAEVLLEDAVRRGARFRPNTLVTGLTEVGGTIRGIAAAATSVAADEVVLAAGVATPSLAATIGIDVPMTSPAGLLVHSRPHTKLLNGLVMAPRLHMRQTAEGRIVSSADFAGGDPGPDPEATADALFAETKDMLRGAQDLRLDFHTIGNRPMPADGFPIVGRAGSRPGLYLAVMHSGITLAAAVGKFAADEILAGRRDPLLAPYGPERFH